MILGYRRLFAGLLLATWAAAAMVAFEVWSPARAAAGVLLLVLAGTLTTYAALPPGNGVDGRLRVVLAAALSAGIALAVGLLFALVADEVPRLEGALALAGTGTLAGAVALWRTDADATLPPAHATAITAPVAVGSALLLGACTILVVAALSVDSLPGKFTSLALTQAGNSARLEIENSEGRTMRYRYTVRGDGRMLHTGALDIGPGQQRTLFLPVAPTVRRLVAALYSGKPTAYRSATLQLRNREPLSECPRPAGQAGLRAEGRRAPRRRNRRCSSPETATGAPRPTVRRDRRTRRRSTAPQEGTRGSRGPGRRAGRETGGRSSSGGR